MKAARSHGSALEFIMRDRGVDRQRDRSDLGRRPQPQVDARDIAVGGALLQQLDHPPADAHRRLAGIVALALRQGLGVEQQEQVDVGRIIELAAAELAHGDHGKAVRLGVGHALARSRQRALDRSRGRRRRTAVAVTCSSESSPARSPSATASARPSRWRRSSTSSSSPVSCSAQLDRRFGAALPKRSAMSGERPQRLAQERRISLRASAARRSIAGGGASSSQLAIAANLVDHETSRMLARFQSE